jgi:protein-tyrosine-phosphatase
MKKDNCNWTIVCYGNILRSQVLEQYLRHHSSALGIALTIHSAGVAGPEEFPDRDKLFSDISKELSIRSIGHKLQRNPWDADVRKTLSDSTAIFCADKNVKATVLDRMDGKIDSKKVYTFYEAINEGEKDFEDTYDYENHRQDPIRFEKAFNELERISLKILEIFCNG